MAVFCEMCGKAASEDAVFCSHCGRQIKADTQACGIGKVLPTYRVTIIKENQWYAINPPINLTVNGWDQYQIKNGGVLFLDLPAGEYHFEFYQSIRTNTVVLNLMGDITLFVRWNRLTGALEVS